MNDINFIKIYIQIIIILMDHIQIDQIHRLIIPQIIQCLEQQTQQI
jgi:hypothetical protein